MLDGSLGFGTFLDLSKSESDQFQDIYQAFIVTSSRSNHLNWLKCNHNFNIAKWLTLNGHKSRLNDVFDI